LEKIQAIAPIRAMEGGTYVHCMANAGTFFWLNAATHVTGQTRSGANACQRLESSVPANFLFDARVHQ
jgi:hypothetical protein